MNAPDMLINRVLEWARTDPGRLIVADSNREVSAADFELQSNAVAGWLIGNGYQGSVIGLSLRRAAEIPVVIIGIWKAGCAYVFLDPGYPVERLKYMISHAQVSRIITSGELQNQLGLDPLVCTQVSELLNFAGMTSGKIASAMPDNRAYIMYTSGSTGKPKGVEVLHRNIEHYIRALLQVIHFDITDRYLHTASFSFSSSVRQFCLPLALGIPVHIAAENQVGSLPELLELVKKRRITLMDSTQSLWRYGLVHLDRMPRKELDELIRSDLKSLLFSGDILPVSLIGQIRRLFYDKIKIYNVYGQTESLGNMVYPLPDVLEKPDGAVPVGFPLPGSKCLVLNESMKPVQEGETGELYISSPCIANGYFNSESLSKSVFLESAPDSGVPGRWLRTGDLVRFRKDKPFEIAGRSDFQIKIRGVRMDIPEIESVAKQYPQVSDSVGVGLDIAGDEKKLVLFVTSDHPGEFDVGALKNHLRKYLNEAFIPEIILVIDAIPLSPNGKIDRKMLCDMASAKLSDSPAHRDRVKNEIQKGVYHAFARVLDRDGFSLTDSFFDLGGHSLKAVELSDVLERVYNRVIPLDSIYTHPTVSSLSKFIENGQARGELYNLVAIQPEGTKKAFICVHGDDANFYMPKYLGDDYPFYGFFHQGRGGEKIRHTTIQSIAKSYVDELIRLVPSDNYVLGGYSIGGVIAFAMAGILISLGKHIDKLILIDSESPDYMGKRMAGRHVFSAEISRQGYSKRSSNLTSDLDPVNAFSAKYRDLYFRYGYYLCILLAGLGIRIPLWLRNSYIIGVYRRARNTYLPESLEVDVRIIRSTVDNFEDYDLGWTRFIRGKMEINELEGNHDTIIQEPQVKYLTEFLRPDLDKP